MVTGKKLKTGKRWERKRRLKETKKGAERKGSRREREGKASRGVRGNVG